MQGIKYHSPKRHKKSLKHARLLVLQRFYFLRTVKDGIIYQRNRIVNRFLIILQIKFYGRFSAELLVQFSAILLSAVLPVLFFAVRTGRS